MSQVIHATVSLNLHPPAFPALLAGKRVAILGAPEARRAWLDLYGNQELPFTLLETRDPREALEAADLLLVLNQSSVEQIGTPDEVYHHPASERVLRLFGPANTLRGRLELRSHKDGGRPVFCSLGGEPAQLLPNWLSPVFENRSNVTFIIRPHDWEVLTEELPAFGPHVVARVGRIHSAGPQVKVTLVGEQGESWTAELSHVQYQRKPFGIHAQLSLRPRAVYVFPADYQI